MVGVFGFVAGVFGFVAGQSLLQIFSSAFVA